MAGGLHHGNSCRADGPESSKDLSSLPADDHDGEWCNHPHIRPALFRSEGGHLAGRDKLKLLLNPRCRLQFPRPHLRHCPANKG